jgi:hypothetical protein
MSPADVTLLLQALESLRTRLHHLDPRRRPSEWGDARLASAIFDELLAIADETLAKLDELERRSEEIVSSAGLEAIDVEDASGVDPTNALAAAAWRDQADTCFTSKLELRRAVQRLPERKVRHDVRVVAFESLHRKLERALRATADGTRRASEGPNAPRSAEGEGDVAAALAVRAMYARFRRSVPRGKLDALEPVMRAVREAGVGLAVMFGSSDFSEVRLADRYLLLGLQARIISWLRGPESFRRGADVVADVRSTADLLMGINLRQELRAHDRAAVRAGLLTRPSPQESHAVRLWLASLRDLRGRDEELDDQLERAQRGALPEAIAPTRAALERLAREMDTEGVACDGMQGLSEAG